MTERTTNEGHEPRMIREVTPSEGVLTSLFQALFWEKCGQRDCSEIARYLYLGDASIVINNSQMTFEEFTTQGNGGAAVDGIKITLVAPEGRGFSEMPATDEEESETEVYIEQLESENRSLKAAHRNMERQIADLEARVGEPSAAGTS